MPRANPIQAAFTGGEWSPLMEGRVDLERYATALKRCLNFIPIPQGGIRNRPGARFLAEVQDSTDITRLIPFENSTEQAYVLEFGDLCFRVYKNRALVESSPGVPLVVVTPWPSATLEMLDWVQSADVLYVVHPDFALRTISRLSDTSWVVAALEFDDGPFLDENVDETIEFTVTATTGAITVTSSVPYFEAAHVGSIFVIWADELDVANLSPWEPDVAYATGQRVYYNGRIYSGTAGTSAKSGTVPPSHDVGSRWDGKTGVNINWLFESSLYGTFRVNGYTNPTTVTADVITTLPFPLSTLPSSRWAEGAISAINGYASCVTFYQDRLVFAATTRQPDTLWFSAVGNYTGFAPRNSAGIVTADLAINVTLTSQKVNKVQWMTADGSGILCGTAANEFLISGVTSNEGLSQSNVSAKPQTSYGSKDVRPIKVGTTVMFVQRSGRKPREAKYDYTQDRYTAPDLSILSEHITASGISEMDFQQEPYGNAWFCLEDGTLVGLTYNSEQEITAWHRHLLGGWSDVSHETQPIVESVCCIPSPDGTHNDLYMVVRRWINGASQRYVEMLDFDRDLDGDIEDAFYLDSGSTFTGPATTVTGAGHLEGETIQVLVDGAPHNDVTVVGGAFDLEYEGTIIHYGYFAKAQAQTMRLEAGAADGTAQGKMKRVNMIKVRVYESVGFRYGPTFDRMDRAEFRSTADPTSERVPQFTGDIWSKGFPGGSSNEGYVCIEQDQPLPLCLLAIMPTLETQGA